MRGIRILGIIVVLAASLWVGYAYPHDHDKPNLTPWFESLHSRKGLCCSGKDGTVLSDVDWESKDGHYRVRIEGEWWDVPDDAVITEPNLDGQTMVWPVYVRGVHKMEFVGIRCFIVGTMG